MATVNMKFRGIVGWNNLVSPDEYPKGTFKWKSDVYLEGEELSRYQQSEMQLRPLKKPQFDKGEGYRFTRKTEAEINGEVVEFSAPQVFNADGSTYEQNFIPNGSEVEIEVQVYDTKLGKGHRLESVTVLKEVEKPQPVEGAVKTNVNTRVATPW